MSRMPPWRAAVAAGAALAGMAFARPGLAQTIGQAASSDVPVWRVVGAFLLCALLAFAAALVLKARLRGGATWPAVLFKPAAERRMAPVETLKLGPQLDVHLFTCDGREVMIAATPNTVVVLREEPPAKPSGRGR